MTTHIDLDAYFARIGYTGSRLPSLANLQAIIERHTQTIPFENLDPLLGQPVRLDLDSLQRKLVQGGRGGYCFEHNTLLRDVLHAMGYHVGGLAARVRWNVAEEVTTPRTHMLLHVDLADGIYIADVGFGGLTLTSALRLEAFSPQSTPHESFRLTQAKGDGYVLQARLGGEWKALYVFDLQRQLPVDFELANWYLSNHPQSHFVTGLMAARALPRQRLALRNNLFTRHHLNGESEPRTLATPAELREVLTGEFGIRLPDTPAQDAAFTRLIEQQPQHKPG
ncbi:arylamine N-acetyltransferase family protein [Methylibium rhizosphaerae]|jgi:N-hydroxyarylamine O-acetyltransferase|uniref:arylamine N-acetyltransferase family protein n=1 Tax=Methylibium rhizosphaerae TaxID=2570323 RepID=UPI0011269CD9|nr:arylamine N-acetyltransferase [Methylibium rhizosphaerae]